MRADGDDAVVRPGSPSFRCLADACEAMCCRNPYRVDLGESELALLAGAVDISDLIEARASMRLMRQIDDRCVLLSDDLRCGAYEARPIGCRDYPFRLGVGGDGRALIVRDLACPGFVGPPMTESEYAELADALGQDANTSRFDRRAATQADRS